jgi:hypothetical protein
MVVFRSLKGYCFRTQPAGDVAAKPEMVSLYSGWFIRFPSLQIMMIPNIWAICLENPIQIHTVITRFGFSSHCSIARPKGASLKGCT